MSALPFFQEPLARPEPHSVFDYFLCTGFVGPVLLLLGALAITERAPDDETHVLLPPDFVRRHLHGGAGVWKAVALGVPLPLCSCGVIPAARNKDGAFRTSSTVVSNVVWRLIRCGAVPVSQMPSMV